MAIGQIGGGGPVPPEASTVPTFGERSDTEFSKSDGSAKGAVVAGLNAVVPGLGTVVQIGAEVYNRYSNIRKVRDAGRAMRKNAQAQAKAIRARAREKVNQLNKQTDRLVGSQQAGFAGAGLSASGGTSQAIQAETRAETLLESEMTIQGANKTAAEIITRANRASKKANKAAEVSAYSLGFISG